MFSAQVRARVLPTSPCTVPRRNSRFTSALTRRLLWIWIWRAPRSTSNRQQAVLRPARTRPRTAQGHAPRDAAPDVPRRDRDRKRRATPGAPIIQLVPLPSPISRRPPRPDASSHAHAHARARARDGPDGAAAPRTGRARAAAYAVRVAVRGLVRAGVGRGPGTCARADRGRAFRWGHTRSVVERRRRGGSARWRWRWRC